MKFLLSAIALLSLLMGTCFPQASRAETDAQVALALAHAARLREGDKVRSVASPIKATGKIVVDYPEGESTVHSWGTGTVIGPQRPDGRWYVLTAAHVVAKVEKTKFILLEKQLAVSVVARDNTSDVAWLLTDARHDGLAFALLAESAPKKGDKIWHNGFGSKRVVHHGTVRAETQSNGQIWTDMVGTFGDSGSAIFRKSDNKVVGVLCGTPNHQAPDSEKIIIVAGFSKVKSLQPTGTTVRKDGEPHPTSPGWKWSAEWKCWWRVKPKAVSPPSC